LRVLSQETLETSKEVKDPSVPGPSLAKEVKDSSLTILYSPDSIQESFVQAGRSLKGFPAGWAHQLRRKDLICFEEARSTGEHTSGVVAISIAPFCISCLRVFFCISILLFSWAYLLKKGASFIEGDLSWKVRSRGLTPYLLHMLSTAPDLQFGSVFIDLEVIFKEAEISSFSSQWGTHQHQI
jgi:hypothetical protein